MHQVSLAAIERYQMPRKNGVKITRTFSQSPGSRVS